MISSPFPDFIHFSSVKEDEFTKTNILSLIHPQERLLISPNANHKRQVQFALGRIAAHQTLLKLSTKHNAEPVLKGRREEPIFPESIVGSISHCQLPNGHSLAICAAAKNDKVFALGVDIQHIRFEPTKRLANFICPNIQELEWIYKDPSQTAKRFIMSFSAKESIYKAFYPICRKYFGFKDACLKWNQTKNSFDATLEITLCSTLQAGFSFEVLVKDLNNDLILTAVCV